MEGSCWCWRKTKVARVQEDRCVVVVVGGDAAAADVAELGLPESREQFDDDVERFGQLYQEEGIKESVREACRRREKTKEAF